MCVFTQQLENLRRNSLV